MLINYLENTDHLVTEILNKFLKHMAKKKEEEEEGILVDSKLMILSGSNFMLKQSKSGYGFFDLYREKTINKGKDNERVDLVLIGHGLSFHAAIQMYILDKLSDKDYTLKEYLKEYQKLLKNIIEEIIYEDK